MKRLIWLISSMALVCLTLVSSLSMAKVEVIDDQSDNQEQTVETPRAPEVSAPAQPATGKKAARKYFERAPSATKTTMGANSHYLALHLGTFAASDTYQWGASSHLSDNGKLNAGVSYRVGEWVNSMDLLFRADVLSYDLPEGRPLKLSLMPVITFPDSGSKFPLFFGAGAGVGIFMKQISGESTLSFDYSLTLGARFFDLFDNVGLLLEGGLKNHILLLSDGQFIGTYIAFGAVFSF